MHIQFKIKPFAIIQNMYSFIFNQYRGCRDHRRGKYHSTPHSLAVLIVSFMLLFYYIHLIYHIPLSFIIIHIILLYFITVFYVLLISGTNIYLLTQIRI